MPRETLTFAPFAGVDGSADPMDLGQGMAAYASNVDPSFRKGFIRGLPDDTSTGVSAVGPVFVPYSDGSKVIEGTSAGDIYEITGDPPSSRALVQAGSGVFVDGSAAGDYVRLTKSATTNPVMTDGTNVYNTELVAPGGSSITSKTLTASTADPGVFPKKTLIFYTVSFTYDDYQEGPIQEIASPSNNVDVVVSTSSEIDYVTVAFNVVPGSLDRITHVNIYRATLPNSATIPADQQNYSWSHIYTEEVSGTTAISFQDSGATGPTYEERTGLPSTLETQDVRYKLTEMAGGYHVIASVYIDSTGFGTQSNWVMRSKFGRPDMYDWANDIIELPIEPTALAYFAGNVFVFGTGSFYRINPVSWTVIDEQSGIGCPSPSAVLATERALFWCDDRNIYMYDGARLSIIGGPTLYDAMGGVFSTSNGWLERDTSVDPVVLYRSDFDLVMFAFKNGVSVGNKISMWGYHVTTGAWTFIGVSSSSTLEGGYMGGEGRPIFSVDGTLSEALSAGTYRSWAWVSPLISDGGNPQIFYEAKVSQQPGTAVSVYYWEDDLDLTFGNQQTASMSLVSGTDGEYTGTINTTSTFPWGKVRSFALYITGSVAVNSISLTRRKLTER